MASESLAEIAADDELLERLRRGEVGASADALTRMLAAWKRSIDLGGGEYGPRKGEGRTGQQGPPQEEEQVT